MAQMVSLFQNLGENKMDKKDLRSLTLEQLQIELENMGEKSFRAKQIFSWLHSRQVRDIDSMTNISKALREKLKENFELRNIEIVEKHHNQKLDAPSGTALALADSMKEVLEDDYFYRYDRSQLRQKRDPKEIGISAVRGGTIVGEHEVIFAGEDEVIEFKHTAHSKAVFAKGAVEAAKFLAGKPAGMYDMRDVIAAKN